MKKVASICLFLVTIAPTAWAAPLMTKAQYEDYSVLFLCTGIKTYGDLSAKNAEQSSIDAKFGVNDDNYEAFEKLIVEYEQDGELLERIRDRLNKECK